MGAQGWLIHCGDVDAQAGDDDVSEQNDEQEDDGIGHNLERPAGHGAMLPEPRVNAIVVA